MALLDKVKVACRVASTAYDVELKGLIAAAFADLGITDIMESYLVDCACDSNVDPLIERAVITYCKMNFGFATLSEDQYNRLKASYDEQKAQMLMSSNYTDWGGSNA